MMSLNNLQNVTYYPVIPYVGTIPEQLKPGTLIVIRGHVPGDSDRFQVDLQNGSSMKPRADVVFHFNPRFKRSNCIVCNTLKNERWGWEEITYDTPFKKEKSFEIVILVLEDKFRVAVNGKHVLVYTHRMPLEKADTLGIYGKVHVHSVGYIFSSMIIYCDVKEFKVAINGVHSLEYRHRLRELADIDTLEVDGDICLLDVRSW